MSLRILHLADVMPEPDSGAAGTDLQGMLALRRAGHTVFDFWADSLSRRIRHYNLRYAFELPFAYRKVVADFIKKQRVDVVQISQPHGYLAAAHVRRYAPSTVVVHRSHGFEGRVAESLKIWEARYARARAVHRRLASSVMEVVLERNNRLIAKHAHGHLVGASECGDFLTARYKVPPENIGLIPQGIMPPYLTNATNVTSERLNRLLYVGQFTFIKAPMILAQAASRALAENPALTFTWVCAKTHHSEALALMDPGVLARVSMLDWMPQPELVEVYDRHGIFIFPSFFEGFGKAFTEAMSRGLIVVAADTGGMKDLISHGVNGFKVPLGDAGSIQAVVAMVLRDHGLAAAISGKAIEAVSSLTWDKFGRDSTVFFECLLRRLSRQDGQA